MTKKSGIGDIYYNNAIAQKSEIRTQTEKSINSLFERKIITAAQKDDLLKRYFSGEISFGEDGLTTEEAKNFTKEDYIKINNTLKNDYDNKNNTTAYIIQAGDTPKKIAEKLGLKGDEAKKFATKIQANAIKAGLYYKFGFKTGDMILLPGNFEKEIENLKSNGEYHETDTEINNNYIKVVEQQKDAKTEESKTENKEVDIKKYKDLKKISTQICDEILENPSASNKNLKKLNSTNTAIILMLYNQNTGRSLAQDIINNGDPNFTQVKNNICWQLAKRAQELKLTGIYFKDYLELNDEAKLISWIENAQNKILEAEKQQNSFMDTFINIEKKALAQRNAKDIQKDGQALANELFKEIDGVGSDANITKNLLKKITPETVAFVINSYLNANCNVSKMGIKYHKENSSHRSLIKDLNEEWGIDINDIKNFICKPLVQQTKNLGLVDIENYSNINDINELNTWINNISEKIRTTMSKNTNITRETVDKNATSQEKINTPVYKEAGVVKISQEYDKQGNVISSTYTYQDGKVVREYQDSERGRVRELLVPGKTDKKISIIKITEAIPITITIPEDASSEEKEFARALEKNKANLMKILGIDNDTYDKLARLAMAIGKHETDFSHGGEYRKGKYKLAKYAPDTSLHDWSYGPTQIKFELQKKDEWIADKFKQLNLKEGVQLYNMENSAMATMIILARNSKILKGSKYQKGAEAARNSVITENGWEIKNGHAKKTGHTKSWVNTVTEEDIQYYFWNGQGIQIIDGTMEPEKNARVRNVRIQLERYEINDTNPNDRNAAIERAIAKQKEAKEKKFVEKVRPLDNNGPIGSITFMPKMYAYSEFKNIDSNVQILQNSLKNNPKIDDNSKKLLLLAVKNGEIAFEFGLKQSEADSLTQKDVDLLLSHLSKLKNNLENKNNNLDFSDGINSNENSIMRNKYISEIKDAELNFKKAYLSSKTPIISTTSVPKENILEIPLNNDLNYSSRKLRRGFAGDVRNEIKDKGVNSQNTTATSYTLAEFARIQADKMNSSGHCMTGFRQAIKSAGVDDSDLIEGTPRGSVGWFERHPEMFEEVKFINIGNNQARQINSTDLPNLPAGYIVVWIPSDEFITEERGYEPGHISITNGNGQAYADETDNLDWGVYHSSKNSGKGEHGTFRVFRLTNNWKVDPETGKLKFCK